MSTYRIEGGAPLRGSITASGAKNAATKQIVASLLTDEEVVLHNVPRIGDVSITMEIVRSLGATVEWSGTSTLHIRAATVGSGEVPVAFVVTDAGMDPDAIRVRCASKLASFKAPRAVVRLDALPRNAMGKLQKHLLPPVP